MIDPSKKSVCMWICALNLYCLAIEIKEEIRELERWFNQMKLECRDCLEKRKIPVKKVVDALTNLPADDVDEHKQVLKSQLSDLYEAKNQDQLIGQLSFSMNYLSYHLLEYLAKEFHLKEVSVQMEDYKADLQQFRMKTPLTLFCQTQKRKRMKPSSEFQEMVAEFDWPENVTLEVVEQFRQEYASHYNLRDCAMMIAQVRSGSFIITWFIPQSVVEKLKANVPGWILKQHSVARLEIAGVCVYRLRQPQKVSVSGCTSSV